MKKIVTLLLALMLVSAMAVPAYAYDGSTSAPALTNWWSWWSDFIPGASEEPTEPEVPELGIPNITTARFYHSASVASLRNRLQISWDDVEGAESYELEVVKADGTIMTYTSTTASLTQKNVACPKVYVEATSTWTAATVRVRAVAGDSVGEWSEAAKIGCDMIH